jgi:hypothetical protein
MEFNNLLTALTVPVCLLLAVGFSAAIVSLMSGNEYDACAPTQPKAPSLFMSYFGHFFVKKEHVATPAQVKLPDMKAYKKIRAKAR